MKARLIGIDCATVDWLLAVHEPRILAIDSPLGWPAPLAPALTRHLAGNRIDTSADDLFQRGTDRFVRAELSKRPFDVGADRIARTAHAALRLLGELRDRLGVDIPLLWETTFAGVAAIEVYPAATLIAHRYRSDGYKKTDQLAERRHMVTQLSSDMSIDRTLGSLEADPNGLDAAVCVLAAKDFLDGRALPPPDRGMAEREGWIWFSPRQREA